MRTPSLLAQCLPGLAPNDKGSQSLTSFSERDLYLPHQPLRFSHQRWLTHTMDMITSLHCNLNVDFDGRVSVADIIGFNSSEMISSKPDGYLKSWDSSIDLVNVLKHEIRDGQLSFRGKRVLEKGKRVNTTVSILARLQLWTARNFYLPEGSFNSSFSRPQCRNYKMHYNTKCDWEELPTVLSVVRSEGFEAPTGMSLSFSEEDFMDGCSSQDGSIIGQESSSRRSRKLSGSRAWERANERDQGEGGYDIILMTDIPYSSTALKKLYVVIKKCLRPPYGVAYLATKKNYVGFNVEQDI
ncbi:hypothetical protein G4B88_011710 [Cannabis sativa]|uniref:Uncharacterized protein n=1 Tax=Cannabis sativa TaxID=3483 RepID=A0A7J6EXY8_CANSA|nr:hypothetical protein G4B88_011710 [Cannabis sativa]